MRKVFGAALVAVVLWGCGHRSFDEKMERKMRDFSRRECPKRVDLGTVCDSATYVCQGGQRLYTVYLTVDSLLDNELLFTREAMEVVRAEQLRDVRCNLQLRQLREHGVTFRRIFRSRSTGKVLLDVTFSAADYASTGGQ